jgi:hypothetical protein
MLLEIHTSLVVEREVVVTTLQYFAAAEKKLS